jgi:hypothetical protein
VFFDSDAQDAIARERMKSVVKHYTLPVGCQTSGAERVVFDLEILSEAETLVRLDEYAALPRSPGWSPATPTPAD